MVGWYHQVSGHELEQPLGDGEGQGGCHIKVHLKKKKIKIGEFWGKHYNIEDGRGKVTFLAYYALLFQER